MEAPVTSPRPASDLRQALHHVADLLADLIEQQAPPARRGVRAPNVPVDDLTRQQAANELSKRGWNVPRRAGGSR